MKVKKEDVRIISNVSFEVSKSAKTMKQFTGLTIEQFEILFRFLNNVCPFNEIIGIQKNPQLMPQKRAAMAQIQQLQTEKNCILPS